MILGMTDGQEHYAANYWGDAKECESRSFSLGPSSKGSASHCGNDLNCTEGNIQKNRIETVKSEIVDDQRPEGTDPATGNTRKINIRHKEN